MNNIKCNQQEKDSIRAEKVNELLNQMTTHFKKAFPTASDLAQWLAQTNYFIMQDKNAAAADDAASFTWYLGYILLPELIDSETDIEILNAIKKALKGVHCHMGCNAYYKAIPFAVCKHMAHKFEYLDSDEDTDSQEISYRLLELENVGKIGSKYVGLVEEIRREKANEHKERRKEEYHAELQSIIEEAFYTKPNPGDAYREALEKYLQRPVQIERPHRQLPDFSKHNSAPEMTISL